jgi:hypothetical protein
METFKLVLFVLAILTSLACTLLLYRGYRNTRLRILLWSSHATALTGMVFLLYGFIRESE